MKTTQLLIISVLLGSLSGCHSGQGSSASENSKVGSQLSLPKVTDLKASHPRLLLSDDQLLDLKQKINADATLSAWYDKVKRDADDIMSLPLSKYHLRDGVRLLWVSNEMVRRMYILAFLYRMEGNAMVLERAWQELEACAAFPDWNPSHFLDVGEMCHAFAIGYDWLYADLTEDQRSIIREALMDKGFEPYLEGSAAGNTRWVKNTQNWNFVCNGGLGIAALSLGAEEEETFGKVMSYVMENLPYAIQSYAPDGAWDEGAGYWDYGTRYLTYLMASLESATGQLYGIPDAAGLAETCYFPIYMSGNGNKSYQFGDGGSKRVSDPAMFWLAEQYNEPVFGEWRYLHIAKGGAKPSIFDLLWYNPEFSKTSKLAELPPDRYFRQVEVVSVRSSFKDKEGFMAGLKGRMVTDLHHNDLDQGSFYLEALGETWAEELGSGHYNAPGYWQYSPLGDRWNYYPKRAEGQNTLVINPSLEADQISDAQSPIISYHSQEDEVFAVTDFTDAYRDHARKVQRGLYLCDDRKTLMIQDEVEVKGPGEIWWFMHTRAEITVQKNAQQVILEKNGKKLMASIQSSVPASFSVVEAVPLPSSPKDKYWNPPAGLKKLAIHFENTKYLTLNVTFKEASVEMEGIDADREIIPMNKWGDN
ncbi:heparinase II/III family protein [Planctomycetota bacterium]